MTPPEEKERVWGVSTYTATGLLCKTGHTVKGFGAQVCDPLFPLLPMWLENSGASSGEDLVSWLRNFFSSATWVCCGSHRKPGVVFGHWNQVLILSKPFPLQWAGVAVVLWECRVLGTDRLFESKTECSRWFIKQIFAKRLLYAGLSPSSVLGAREFGNFPLGPAWFIGMLQWGLGIELSLIIHYSITFHARIFPSDTSQGRWAAMPISHSNIPGSST